MIGLRRLGVVVCGSLLAPAACLAAAIEFGGGLSIGRPLGGDRVLPWEGQLSVGAPDAYQKFPTGCAFNLGYDLINREDSDSGPFDVGIFANGKLLTRQPGRIVPAGKTLHVNTQAQLAPGIYQIRIEASGQAGIAIRRAGLHVLESCGVAAESAAPATTVPETAVAAPTPALVPQARPTATMESPPSGPTNAASSATPAASFLEAALVMAAALLILAILRPSRAVTGITLLLLAAIDYTILSPGAIPKPAPEAAPTAAATPSAPSVASPASPASAPGQAPADAAPSVILQALAPGLHQTEHALFIVPDAGRVKFPDWDSVFSWDNIAAYVATLKRHFPRDYFAVVVTASGLTPNHAPSFAPSFRHVARGIGRDSASGVNVPNICRYHVGQGSFVEGSYGVLDHEIGHAWGVFLGPEIADMNGHWLPNSTVRSQMGGGSFDGGSGYRHIVGDPEKGFGWELADNTVRNLDAGFAEQDLYSMGLAARFPDTYVLDAPNFHSDGRVTHSGFRKYDHAWVVARHGVRVPDYRDSQKRFPVGFVYIARDDAEVRSVYRAVEQSIVHFTTGEAIDATRFRFQVPFLVETKFRASIDALLADLDGNASPVLTLKTGYLQSSDGTATLEFSAIDPDGPRPDIELVPPHAAASMAGDRLQLRDLAPGSHFLTLRATDIRGKKAYAHFVVDRR